MFQKVSENQLFLFEVWGTRGFIIPAPAAFHKSKGVWKATGKIGNTEFEVVIDETHVGKENIGKELPIVVKDNLAFEMEFSRSDEKDSMEGKIKFL